MPHQSIVETSSIIGSCHLVDCQLVKLSFGQLSVGQIVCWPIVMASNLVLQQSVKQHLTQMKDKVYTPSVNHRNFLYLWGVIHFNLSTCCHLVDCHLAGCHSIQLGATAICQMTFKTRCTPHQPIMETSSIFLRKLFFYMFDIVSFDTMPFGPKAWRLWTQVFWNLSD